MAAPGMVEGRLASGLEWRLSIHSAEEGVGISLSLMQMAARPLLEALSRVLQAEEVLRTLLSEGGSTSWEELLALLPQMDLSGIGGELQVALAAHPDLPGLMKRVLKYTHVKLPGEDKYQPAITSSGAFSPVFQAKYQTLFLLTWKAIQANGFLLLPATS